MKKTGILITLIICLVIGGCSKGGEVGDHKNKENSESKASGYQKNAITKPEGAAVISDLIYLQDGTLRIAASDAMQTNVKIWDSQDEGNTWEEKADLTAVIASVVKESPTIVYLSPTGALLMKNEQLYYVDENNNLTSISESVPDGSRYRFTEDGSLYTYDLNQVYFINVQNGEVTQQIEFQNGEGFAEVVVSGDYIFAVSSDNEANIKISQCQISTGEKKDIDSKIHNE